DSLFILSYLLLFVNIFFDFNKNFFCFAVCMQPPAAQLTFPSAADPKGLLLATALYILPQPIIVVNTFFNCFFSIFCPLPFTEGKILFFKVFP
ncbi:MAG: hypothetical protein Q4G07_12085, partial [Oscillospiraceae bacterium]|nr:hypothetical protein [Oscillospiraceae bacterium]